MFSINYRHVGLGALMYPVGGILWEDEYIHMENSRDIESLD